MKPAEVSTPSDREVLVKRSFDAPVNLVWQAYTDPALMRRWLTAMPGWSMPVCEMATHVGGKYRWRWRDNENGQEFGFTGEMLEVALHSFMPAVVLRFARPAQMLFCPASTA